MHLGSSFGQLPWHGPIGGHLDDEDEELDELELDDDEELLLLEQRRGRHGLGGLRQ